MSGMFERARTRALDRITVAEAQGEQEVAGRLRENLEQEQHTLDEVRRAMRKVAGEVSHQAA